MDDIRERGRCALTIAIVVGFHLTIIGLLLTTIRRTTVDARSGALQISFFSQAAPSIEIKPNRAVARSIAPAHRDRTNPAPRAMIGPRTTKTNDAPTAVDWADELTRVAREGASEDSAQRSRVFGFPHRPETPARNPPEFSWDHAAIHRFESIPGGGLLVHLNDDCVLMLAPLPFAACSIGKKNPNGHLLDHIRDPPSGN